VLEELLRVLTASGTRGVVGLPADDATANDPDVVSVATAAVVGAESGPSSAPMQAASTEVFYATAAGSVYHRADCAVIAHHTNELRRLGPSDLGSLRPCQICSP
jgi:hypothetical protein